MNIKCALAFHRAVLKERYNEGYYFSSCAACGSDLVRRSGGRKWRAPPKGYRVVWKKREAWQIDWDERMRGQLPEGAVPIRLT
jgi:hypothetical protein